MEEIKYKNRENKLEQETLNLSIIALALGSIPFPLSPPIVLERVDYYFIFWEQIVVSFLAAPLSVVGLL